MTLAEIAEAVGGRVVGDPTVLVRGPAYLDSRRPDPGGLFVAIVGDRTDGHHHAGGAHAVLGSRPTGRPGVLVADPGVALAALARHVVRRLRPRVFALTGSHGKTGTKDLLAALLPSAVATIGNLNNELGVPLTALRLGPDDRDLVLEMGARGLGHLDWLCDLARPRVAAVLNVGAAHVAEFGSVDLIARAKGELVEALPADGTAVLNADDPRVIRMADRTVARVLTFGRDDLGTDLGAGGGVGAGADVGWSEVELDRAGRASFRLRYGGSSSRVRLAGLGAHQVPNAAAAAAMAFAAGEPLDRVAAGLSAARPVSASRMQLHHRADGLQVIDDSYNASPASVRAALETLATIGRRSGRRTVAVLGEMRELGAASAQAHVVAAAAAGELGIDELVTVGAAWPDTAGVRVRGRADALSWLERQVRPGDVLLVKASRAVGLELLVRALVPAESPRNNGRVAP